MPKAEGDPRTRDVAGAGRERGDVPAAHPTAESSNVKSAGAATSEDDIPPIHVLEAAQQQDRKEAEDLLAGFDRPGRSPKVKPKERDFVDYYAKKKNPSGVEGGTDRPVSASQPAAAPPRPRQMDVSTVIRPRKREGAPAWLVWPAAGLLMLLIGGAVAYFATSEKAPTAAAAGSAAATLTTGPLTRPGGENIPPPDPPSATATTTTAMTVIEPSPAAPTSAAAPGASAADPGSRGTAKREPRGGAAGAAPAATGGAASASPPNTARAARGATATDDTKPPPRDDFIRDL